MKAAVHVIRDVTDIRQREIELSWATAELHGRVQLTDAILRSNGHRVIVVDRNARLT